MPTGFCISDRSLFAAGKFSASVNVESGEEKQRYCDVDPGHDLPHHGDGFPVAQESGDDQQRKHQQIVDNDAALEAHIAAVRFYVNLRQMLTNVALSQPLPKRIASFDFYRFVKRFAVFAGYACNENVVNDPPCH